MISLSKKEFSVVILSLISVLIFCALYLYLHGEIYYESPFIAKLFSKSDGHELKRDLYRVPSSGRAHKKLAYLYLEKGDIDRFETEIKETIELEPSELYCLYSQGLHYELKKDFEKALVIYTAGTKADEKFRLPFYYYQGQVYLKLGRKDEALASFEEALKHIDSCELAQAREGVRKDLKAQIGKLKKEMK